MSDGAYCKTCHSYRCFCPLLEECATLTRQRNEARQVARDLLSRCAALIKSDLAAHVYLSGRQDGRWDIAPDPIEEWKKRYPWLRETE